MSREITSRYEDPLERIWLACAERVGLRVVRGEEVYASFDGERTLTLCTRAAFDPDDSLAQMILHELCHGLVAGPNAARADWGLSNEDARDLVLEHACHRVQAALADRHGLRALFAVTTEWRPYWDALPIDPLRSGADPAIAIARVAFERARSGSWATAIEDALHATAQIAAAVRAAAPPKDSLWAQTHALHASGFPLGEGGNTCGQCAWSARKGKALRCRQSAQAGQGVAVHEEAAACNRYEPRLGEHSCATCGACCREGYDRVDVRPRDRVHARAPELISRDRYGEYLARPKGLCVALEGDGSERTPYRCRIYDARPRACAELEVGGDACLLARRRVGLSA